MGIQKLILNIILNIEAFCLSMLKVKDNRITFISLESNQLSLDFLLIYNALDLTKYDVKLCLIKYKKNLWGQFLYFINCMKQLYYVRTSKVILLHDNNYVVSHFKSKNVKVIQVWHACGAIKKFGNVIERKYPIQNYDYVLATSTYWQDAYSQAFGVDRQSVLPYGLPRTDHLFDSHWIMSTKEKMYEKYPELKNKKIILYAPTFRGNIYKGFEAIDFDVKTLLGGLDEDYMVIYKFHPLMCEHHLDSDSRVICMNHEDTHELFCISDYLISDYSSIIFDYMILQKPILLYVPDYKDYCNDLGVFVDINDLHYPICKSVEDIQEVIKTDCFDKEVIETNKDIFFDYQDGKSTKRIIDFINSLLNSLHK